MNSDLPLTKSPQSHHQNVSTLGIQGENNLQFIYSFEKRFKPHFSQQMTILRISI